LRLIEYGTNFVPQQQQQSFDQDGNLHHVKLRVKDGYGQQHQQ
jgi:hypothetical protein